MHMTETVSAKIPDDLKRAIGEAVRDALESEIKERRQEELRNDATSIREDVGDGTETDEIVTAVREAREDR